jgi:hypothetical protein
MLAVEARRAPELNPFSVHQEAGRAERRADVRVGQERRDRAVDVELCVRAGVSAIGDPELEQLGAMLLQKIRHPLEERAALREGQRPQGRAARAPRVVQSRGYVEPAAARERQGLFGGWIEKRLRGAFI